MSEHESLLVVGDGETEHCVPYIEIGMGAAPNIEIVCDVHCSEVGVDNFVITEEDREFARRLVATWNACQGIETADLEKGTDGWLAKIIEIGGEATARADEATALLLEAVGMWGPDPFESATDDFSNKVRAFLAKPDEAVK